MNWSDVAKTVGEYAPVAGSLLAGEAGAMVGRKLAGALGVSATPDSIASALKADPEAALKVRQVDAELERSLIESRADVVKAEASGESWLQRNWRPMLMIWFAILVGCYWFGWTPENLSQETVNALFDIVKMGVTGYIAGRSIEKIARDVSGSGFMDRIRTKR